VIEDIKTSINPNVNCLDGKRCPECGSFGPFEVIVSMRVLLSDNGTDYAKDGAAEFGDDAPAMCLSCQHKGQFGEFDE
jgi:hypothetical protein